MSEGWIGLFDLFRIGVGPSSSHTVGPMLAAAHFAASLDMQADAIRVELFGSLALTGKGHGTDTAVILGLGGARPDALDPDDAAAIAAEVRRTRRLTLPSGRRIGFDADSDIVFRPRETLPVHPSITVALFRSLRVDPGDGERADERSILRDGAGGVGVFAARGQSADASAVRAGAYGAVGRGVP